VASELGIVAAHVRDEPLRVLAPDERLDGVAERRLGARAIVEDHVDPHAGRCCHVPVNRDLTAASRCSRRDRRSHPGRERAVTLEKCD
jgi:hypothetical protein